MATSLIRSRAMITRAIDRHHWDEVADGAVLQEDGVIVAIGTYEELQPALSRTRPSSAPATRSCCRASSTATIMSA